MHKPKKTLLKSFLLIIVLLICFNAKAQLSIANNESFTIQPQKGNYAYTVYWYPFSDYMLKHLGIHEKTVTEKGEVENGLIKRKLFFNGLKLESTETSFYKDSLLVRFIRKNAGFKHAEIYNYKYNHVTKENISAMGTKNGKLIYSVVRTRFKDSIIERRIYNYDEFKVKGKDVTFYAHDSLIKTVLSYTKVGYTYYKIEKYSPKKILLEEIDSSDNDVNQKKYFYDATGRLNEKRSYRNSIFDYLTEYKYDDYKTIISSYPFYDGKKGQISKEHLMLYDKNGLLIYEKTIEYDKLEGIIPDGKTVTPEPTVEAGLIMIKCYKQNRLVQFQIFHGGEVDNCYEVEYK